MNSGRRLGILGGTFDPIHLGHLDAAEAARRALQLDEVLLVPAADPPHRSEDPRAGAFHRFALVSLAINGRVGYRASDLELLRSGPSYTVDTLRTLHTRGWEPSQLFFITGADAFAEIATWRAFPSVLDAAHFVVIARPGASLDAACGARPEVRSRVRRLEDSLENGVGTHVYLVEAATRDVSSTTIRSRLAQQLAIDDLVPAAVARHIASHQLYGAANRLHGQDTKRGE